ncbi:MAG: imidazole glycerol phosphate synthase subunit HisH [Candidatus Omnitrophica bacterium]|nr:imidazole glycerol phosphate synthase subunit HisH [Candidatus Omnitrophota bacterium]
MIAIVDYGMGNLRSVEKALEHVGGKALVTSDPAQVEGADKVIVPGVGAFDQAIRELRTRRLWDPLQGFVRAGKPFLGVCLGFQLLFESSEEGQGAEGLGVFRGRVRRFRFEGRGTKDVGRRTWDVGRKARDQRPATSDQRLKIPHMGWNTVTYKKGRCPLFKGVPDDSFFYFVHSYYADCTDRGVVAGETEYGVGFASALWGGAVFGTQFHPEKSQAVGLQLLKNFVEL